MQESLTFLTNLIGVLPISTLSAVFVAVFGLIYGAIKIYSAYKNSQARDEKDIKEIQKSTSETATNIYEQSLDLNAKLNKLEKKE